VHKILIVTNHLSLLLLLQNYSASLYGVEWINRPDRVFPVAYIQKNVSFILFEEFSAQNCIYLGNNLTCLCGAN